MGFTRDLLNWYDKHKRDLPWRTTTDPYRIWLSEIILQQTRIDQGLKYYHTFIENYPTVKDLAEADEEQILKDWQGLGYYSRARNLHFSAKYIQSERSGKFPDNYLSILKLKGVGPYTAAAIASISFNEAIGVVDGNVLRFISRMFGIHESVSSGKGKKAVQAKVDQLIDKERPGDYNQAIMELGATICTPKNPDCEMCPVKQLCYAFENGQIHELPNKDKSQHVKKVYYHYLLITDKSVDPPAVICRKRVNMGIWKNLYDFPCIETESDVGQPYLLAQIDSLLGTGMEFSIKRKSGLLIHILSHRKIHACFYEIHLDATHFQPDDESYKKVPLTQLLQLPVPRLIDRFLSEYNYWFEEM